VHLRGGDGSGQDTATNRDHTREGALLVDVRAINGRLGRAETQTDFLVPSLGPGVLARASSLVVVEDVRLFDRISIVRRVMGRGGRGSYLLLESALRLDTVYSISMELRRWVVLRRT
jgi:hypothetical protein